MEVKKSQKTDLENKKSLFFQIGLCASLLLMIGAFAWGTGSKEVKISAAQEEEFVPVEQVENTEQDMPVPQMPTPAQTMSVLTDNIQIVDNSTQVETQLEFADFEESMAFNANPTSATEIQGDLWPDFFEKVEHMPKFQGGDIQTFRTWVLGRVRYPEMAQSMGITGTVTVRFMVNPDGTVGDVEVMSKTDRSLNNEAIRVVKSSPKWEPGRQGVTPVKVRFTIDVKFQMQ
jgi:protein TonB